MYVFKDKYGKAVLSTSIPDVESYWEIDEFPSGDGDLMITEDGNMYWNNSTNQFPSPQSSQDDAHASALISALID